MQIRQELALEFRRDFVWPNPVALPAGGGAANTLPGSITTNPVPPLNIRRCSFHGDVQAHCAAQTTQSHRNR